jgi:TfoX/Sxy family transcriptional regulator of competence genes
VASDLEFVAYVCDQIGAAGHVAFRKMFGEYAMYCDGKVVALVCDNQLFVKPTAGGRGMIGRVVEALPYPGAKPWLIVDERLDDREWMARLIRVTAAELPVPKPKLRRTKPSRG